MGRNFEIGNLKFDMKKIKTVGVIGAGTMGAALAQKFAQEGFNVILADKSLEFLNRGLANIRAMLEDAVQKKVFAETEIETFMTSLSGTTDLGRLGVCDLVVEAVFENFGIKCQLFTDLSSIVSSDCIIATNTSSFAVSELAECFITPENFIGLHFFYHAAKNRLVEIIPGAKTSTQTVEAIKRFCFSAGKDPIQCKDSYGFAVNRFFVPWLNESVRLMEEGVGTKEEIDTVCMDVFGIGMGPFALMNATGVPVAYHSQKTLEVYGGLYKVSGALKVQAELGKPWELNDSKTSEIDREKRKFISDRMLGIVFFVALQILDEKVCSPGDLDLGAQVGLRWKKGPVEMMKKMGENEVRRLIALIGEKYHTKLPQSIGNQYWKSDSIQLEKNGPIAVLTFRQPQNLNALSKSVMEELNVKFNDANIDPSIKTIFITGSGKAFVAGADIKFFVNNIKNDRICDIESFTAYGQNLYERIDKSPKQVVAILNGLTLGGGLELALCADMIMALPKAQLAFPETGIGIYPGLGGTQRSARKIGKALSKYLIHTGKMISARDAEEIGLVDKVIGTDEMFDILSGSLPLPLPVHKPLSAEWQHIKEMFDHNTLDNIIKGNYDGDVLKNEDMAKIKKIMLYKAPLALKLADTLIDEEKGPASELAHLREIFSTEDALLGLSNVGKRVEFKGK